MQQDEITPQEVVPVEAVATVATADDTSQPVIQTESSGEVYGLRMTDLRGLLIKMILACLVAAASVAVIAILVGSMNELVGRSLGTIVVAIVHIVLIFGVISVSSQAQNDVMRRSNTIFANAAVTLVILSFFTAVFHIWYVLPSDLASKLYSTYIVVLFGLMHVKILMDVGGMYTKSRPYVYANYVFIVLVTLLILGVIYSGLGMRMLDGFYGRLLAASAVVDVTLSIVVAVLAKLHIQKNPELYQDVHAARFSVGRIIVMILLFLFVGWPVLNLLMFSVYSR